MSTSRPGTGFRTRAGHRVVLGAPPRSAARRDRRGPVRFTAGGRWHRVSPALSCLLIGFFPWPAQNSATRFAAWRHPCRLHGREAVSVSTRTSRALPIGVIFVARRVRLPAPARPASLPSSSPSPSPSPSSSPSGGPVAG
ncbi:DUF817 family protein [Streptomyces fagopyri]|uniref:DUF817 family protein n=1 Tax=Streptomyces fagopyri TaxID=2662397 RepID=UPI0038213DC6